MNSLFERYVSNYAIGELPKIKEVPSPERLRALGYVETAGGWVPESEAVRLPQGDTMVWVKM